MDREALRVPFLLAKQQARLLPLSVSEVQAVHELCLVEPAQKQQGLCLQAEEAAPPTLHLPILQAQLLTHPAVHERSQTDQPKNFSIYVN